METNPWPTRWNQFLLCSSKWLAAICVSTGNEHVRQLEFLHLNRNIKTRDLWHSQGLWLERGAVWWTCLSWNSGHILQKQGLWEMDCFFFFGLLVSFLGPSVVVTMRAVKNCQPSHPNPSTLHCTPLFAPLPVSSRSCWSSPHHETLSAALLQGSIHLLWWAKQHLPRTFVGSQTSSIMFLTWSWVDWLGGFLVVYFFFGGGGVSHPEKWYLVALR